MIDTRSLRVQSLTGQDETTKHEAKYGVQTAQHLNQSPENRGPRINNLDAGQVHIAEEDNERHERHLLEHDYAYNSVRTSTAPQLYSSTHV